MENTALKVGRGFRQKKMMCTVCSRRYKEVILAKCFHTFCKECIAKSYGSRNRQCPQCRVKFAQNEIHAFF